MDIPFRGHSKVQWHKHVHFGERNIEIYKYFRSDYSFSLSYFNVYISELRVYASRYQTTH